MEARSIGRLPDIYADCTATTPPPIITKTIALMAMKDGWEVSNGDAPPVLESEGIESVARPAATTRTIISRASLIDLDIAAVERAFVQCIYGLFRFGIIGHLDKTESLRLSRHSIHDYVRAGDFAEIGKRRSQFILGNTVRQVADIYIHDSSSRTHTPEPCSRKSGLTRFSCNNFFGGGLVSAPNGAGTYYSSFEARRNSRARP
jgi:hypothetical protein